MTTDRIQEKKLELKTRLLDTSRRTRKQDTEKGFELTRVQGFVDGGHDIFDVLDGHTANSQMKIKANDAANSIDADLKDTPLFQSLLNKLRNQMRDMVEL